MRAPYEMQFGTFRCRDAEGRLGSSDTGRFLDRAGAGKHLQAGAKKVRAL